MKLTPQERKDIERIAAIGRYATVLLIMFRLNRPATVTAIARLAHINQETAREHLRGLAELHYITSTRAGWHLTAGGRQLLLPAAENPRTLLKDSFSSFSSNRKEEETEGRILKKPAENPRPGAEPRGISAPPGIPVAIQEAYRQAGICINSRTARLAQQPWITPEYIAAHHASLSVRGKGQATGLLITILESAEPAPVPPADNDRTRYITGKYSDCIEH